MAAPYRSAQKLRRDNCLSEITSNASLKATALANLGLTGASVGSNYATTPTGAGITTLTATSQQEQFFTGSTTQNVIMPVVSTLKAGQQFNIYNASTGAVTVKSSGSNTIVVMAGSTAAIFTAVKVDTTTDATAWSYEYLGELVSSAKLLTVTNSLTLSGTDSTTMTFPSTSATIARTDAANTFTGHQTIEGVATTGATGTGNLVFASTPTIVSPVISTGLTASGSASNDYSASTGTFKTSTGANTLGGSTVLAATKSLTLAAGTATATQAPAYFTAGGVLLTAAEAGAIENDAISTYITNETSSGRGLVPVKQFFQLTSDGGTISTIANFFGATSNLTLVSGGYYEIEAVMYFTNSADTNTVTWTLVNSASPTAQNIYFEMSPAAGVVAPPGTATALVGQFVADATATKAWNSGALGSAASYYSRVRMWLKNGTGTSLKFQMTKNTGGTATPKAGSWWSAVRLPAANVGNFAA